MSVLYQNRRAWRARVAQAAIWGGAAACVWVAAAAPRPNDTMADTIVVWVGVIFMLACVAAFEVYLRLYVLRIVRDDGALRITTLSTLHHRCVSVDAETASFSDERHEHAPPGLAPGHDNSWRGLRAKGHRFAFIVDTTQP